MNLKHAFPSTVNSATPATKPASGSPWTPDPNIRWHFDIDIVGGCNLRCPTCPVGNLPDIRVAKGYMQPSLLEQIVRKAIQECNRLQISLYNWTEPFIHPKLGEMIRVVRSHDLRCLVSSNLNIIKNIDDVMAADPTRLRTSVSGFSQETYGITHKSGDIDLVKKNMALVARARDRNHSSTELELCFHRYLGNHEEEDQMRRYAESLGFKFVPVWAYFMPLEKVLAYADADAIDVRLTEEDRSVIDRLALPLDKALAASKKYRDKPCVLQEQQLAITLNGDVMLCCSVYDQSKYTLGSYLDMPLREIQEKKYQQSICGTCMKNGAHSLAVYGAEELDQIALANVAEHHPDAKLKGMQERARERHRLDQRLLRKAKRGYRKVRRKIAAG